MSRAARISGSRLWLGTAVVLVAVLIGLRSLSTLLAPGTWWETGVMLVIAVAALVATLRQVLRSRLAPTAWGLLAAVIGLTSLYGDAVSGPSVPRPTAETVERLNLLVDAGIQTIVEGRIPVQPTRGLELLVVTGAVAAYLVAELLALGLGRGGLAGVAIAGLWAPAVSYERDGGFLLLLGAGTTYLMLLALTRPRSRRNDRSAADEAPRATAIAAGLTVVALGLGLAATGLPFHGSVRLPSGWGDQGLDAPLRISTDLDMRADLQGRSDRALLRYTGDAGAINALRMYTLTDFDGRQWLPPATRRDLQSIDDGVLWPDEVSVSDPAETPATIEVEVLSLSQDRLPVPPEPREVDAPGVWLYDAQHDEVVASDRSTRGLSYSITVHSRELTADGLRADGAGSPEDAADYLAVPATEHEADIRALAQQVVIDAGAATTYDQAIAVQSFLRNAQDFTYSTELGEPQTDDAVWDFLTDRRGYCVQYATAMTIMARALGIPARMAVGFLPGRADGEVLGQYVVSGRQAHTWPELYFEDAGWVRFEPTPARQTGAPPVYADPFAGVPVGPDGIPTSAAVPSGLPTAGPGAAADDRPGYVSIGQTDLPILVVVGIAGTVVLGLTVLIVLVVRRRRRVAATPQGAEEWWAALRERLAEHGVVWTDATTPRQAARVVRERLPRPDLADPAELTQARGALDNLVTAVETERYTTRTPSVSTEELGGWVEAVERPLTSTITGNGESS